MQVNVGPIRRQQGASVPIQVYTESPERSIDEVEFLPGAPFVVQGNVTNTGKGFLAEGTVRSEVQLECSRCLKPLRMPLVVTFCERFYPEGEGVVGSNPFEETDETDDEADEVHHFRGDVLDLTDAIREQVLVSIPMKPVCEEDCKGMCATCGADLADGPCGCSDDPVDIRLAPLAEWLKAAQERNGDTKE